MLDAKRHSIELESPVTETQASSSEDVTKDKSVIRTHATDLEADESVSAGKGVNLNDPHTRELVSAEVFTWNVEGDQSPCE